jgi:hypothetical protein
VFPRPAGNLFGLSVGSAVAVFLAAIALVQEALIVALELVVENDSANPATLASKTLLRTLICPIHLGVVRQLARLPETGVERLTGFVAAVSACVAVCFEKISAALGQDDGAVV